MKIDNLIKESKSSPLYHGTDVFSLIWIISTNELLSGMSYGRDNEINGVRTSRDYRVAKKFVGNSNPDLESHEGGVIALNQQKISNNFKIKPYHDYDPQGGGAHSDEMEEVIVTNSLKIDHYILWFTLSDEVINFALSDEGWDIYDNWQGNMFKDQSDLKKRAEFVRQHPKRKNI